jgi:hypothetical protein
MSKTDSWVNIILITVIAAYIIVWIAGLVTHKLVNYFSMINAVTALAILIYWIQKQLHITQHYVETREIIFLGVEALFAGISIYTLFSSLITHWLKVAQYIIFSLHLIVLVLFLIFMLTFKMKKLI